VIILFFAVNLSYPVYPAPCYAYNLIAVPAYKTVVYRVDA